MKTLHEELMELAAIMEATTDESDTRYQEKFLCIKANYPTQEDADVIADFIMNRYDALADKVKEFKTLLNLQY